MESNHRPGTPQRRADHRDLHPLGTSRCSTRRRSRFNNRLADTARCCGGATPTRPSAHSRDRMRLATYRSRTGSPWCSRPLLRRSGEPTPKPSFEWPPPYHIGYRRMVVVVVGSPMRRLISRRRLVSCQSSCGGCIGCSPFRRSSVSALRAVFGVHP